MEGGAALGGDPAAGGGGGAAPSPWDRERRATDPQRSPPAPRAQPMLTHLDQGPPALHVGETRVGLLPRTPQLTQRERLRLGMAAGHQDRRSSSQLGPDNLKRGGRDRIPGPRAGKPDSEALKRETLVLFKALPAIGPGHAGASGILNSCRVPPVSPAVLPSFFFLSCARRSVRACPGFGPTGPVAGRSPHGTSARPAGL